MNARADTPDCPYVGLAPFDAEHAEYFFGRTLDSAVLADNVLARQIVVFYGTSGVGKSSVLNVGLPRALAEQGVSARIASRREWHEPAILGRWLDGVITETLATPRQPLVLVLDQFEEYFLYPSAAQVKEFAGALAALIARTDVEAHLLIALRDDGLHRLDAMRRLLPRVLDTTLELRHLSEPAVREAITQPIEVWNRHHTPGVTLDPDFADALIAQLRPKDPDGQPVKGGRIELAYLQLALDRIWDAEGGEKATALRTSTLTDRLMGIGEISRRHVEEVLGKLPAEDQSLCATVFDRLVTPSGGKILYTTQDLAAVAKVDTKRMEEVLAPLASGKTRLLRSVELPGGKGVRGYEILHDILARPILAWTADRTAQVERARADAEARAREKAENDRARIARLSYGLVGLAGLLLIAGGIAVWSAWHTKRLAEIADRARDAAQASSRQANSLRLVAEAQAILSGARSGGEERAFLRLLAAERIAPSPETQGGLLNALLPVRDLRKLIVTGAPVNTVAFSPDSRRIVTGSSDSRLRLWDAVTGIAIGAPLEGHKALVASVAFSPDGRRIASGGLDNTVRLWDAASGKPVGGPLEGHKDLVSGVVFSPDGRRIVSGSADGTLRVWDAETGKPIGPPLVGHAAGVASVALSPDGRRIVSGSSDSTVRLWDAATGKPIGAPLKEHRGSVDAVAFSPDGRRLVSGGQDGKVRLWDVGTGKPLGGPMEGHRQGVSGVAFSPDGRLIVSGSLDGTLRLWSAETGRPLGAPLEAPKDLVSSVAFSPDGKRVLAGSYGGNLRLWDARPGRPLALTLEGHEDDVTRVAFSPDGRRVVSGSYDGRLRIWDAETGDPVGTALEGHARGVIAAAYSPDGRRIVSGSSDNTLRLWDAVTRTPVGAPLAGHTGLVSSVAFSPDGRLIVSGSQDKTLRLWDAESGKPAGAPLEGHTDGVTSVAFSPDARRVASGSMDGTVRVWDAATGKPIGGPLEGHKDYVASVAFSPDGGRIVSGSGDDTLRLWDVETGKLLLAPYEGHTAGVESVGFSPDGRRILSGSQDKTLRLWDAATGKALGAPLEGHKESVTSVAYGPDGRHIASGSADRTVRLWDIPVDWPGELCAKLTHNMSVKQWREWVAPDLGYVKPCPDLPIPEDAPPAASSVGRR